MSTSTTARPVSKTIGVDLPNGDYVEITALLRIADSRGISDGFSVTTSGWEKRGTRSGRVRSRTANDIDYGGCQHDLVLEVAPHLEPVVRVHLADPDGVPMHALANGWYEYTGKSREYEIRTYGQAYADRRGTSHERAAEALNIPADQLPTGLDQGGFADFVQTLVPVWEEQAQAALRILADLEDQAGVEARR